MRKAIGLLKGQQILSIVSLMAILTASCKKSGASAPSFTPGYTIYMAGTSNGNAVYWKNGLQTNLAPSANALSIMVSDTDVYVSGTLNNGFDIYAVYWKNGQQFQLESTGISHAFGIAVNGTDIYCAGDHLGPIGSSRDTAMYWKNNQPFTLSPFTNGVAKSIVVAGTKVYVTGQVWAMNWDTAVVWKNGVQTYYGEPGCIYAAAMSATDTFFVGNIGNMVDCWKTNGFKTLSNNGFAGSVAINGPDYYVGGGTRDSIGQNHAAYWKNEVLNILPNNSTSSTVNGIAIAGIDVYAVGYYYDKSKNIPVYWKNGVLTKLGDDGVCTAIYIRRN